MTAVRLVQHGADGERRVILAEGATAHFLAGCTTTRELALAALADGDTLLVAAQARRMDRAVDLAVELAAGQLLAAIDHPDPARLLLAGTGLTHLGPTEGRDAMHHTAAAVEQPADSFGMFLDGVAGGRRRARRATSPNGSTRATARTSSAPSGRRPNPALPRTAARSRSLPAST